MLLAFALLARLLKPVTGLELNGVGKLPALGWNSWNAFGCNIQESHFLDAAQSIVDLGFKDAGYQYVNIDDCWSMKDGRDPNTGRLLPNLTRFPDGINGTADKIHNLGLKIGIYSSAGDLTCAEWPASLGQEELDAQTWAEWGIDYLKYDNCNFPDSWKDECNACVHDGTDAGAEPKYNNYTCTDQTGLCPDGYDYSKSKTAQRFSIMRDALKKQSQPIEYALCEWGFAGVQYWGGQVASSWRMSRDITPTWELVSLIINSNSFMLNSVDFYAHADMDMLEVGNGLSYAESRSHFALWAAMKSPLLIGTPLGSLGSELKDIMLNKPLLAFNQDDQFGKPAMPYKWGTNPDWSFNRTWPAEYWYGHSKAGTLVLLLNPGASKVTKSAVWAEIPGLTRDASYKVTNVWTGEDKGCVSWGFEQEVDSHDTLAFLVNEGCGGKIDTSDRTPRPHN